MRRRVPNRRAVTDRAKRTWRTTIAEPIVLGFRMREIKGRSIRVERVLDHDPQ